MRSLSTPVCSMNKALCFLIKYACELLQIRLGTSCHIECVCVCVYLSMNMYMTAGAGRQVPDPLERELKAVMSHLLWVLGTAL